MQHKKREPISKMLGNIVKEFDMFGSEMDG